MRVVIDATPVLLRSAGVKNFIYHWLRHLRLAGGEKTFPAYPFIGRLGELHHDASVMPGLPTYTRIAMLHFANISGNPVLDWMLRGADLLHASNQLTNPPRRLRLTATVHDMTCWIAPELHTPANVLADRRFAQLFLKRAAGVIAVSENTRSDLLRLVDLDPAKVTTIHPGVPELYFGNAPKLPSSYGLDKSYFLYVGTVEPRKNIDAILDAYTLLPEELRRQTEMAVAGPVGWASQRTMARLRERRSGFRYLGYVPERDLVSLTQGAAAFVYPSLYEGFGFPVAQAMAAGVPVITSAVSSLPEITGGTALLVDPRSVSEISSAMLRILTNRELAASLGAAGRARASSSFRWAECARRSIDFFKDAIGRS
jgi:alpha-1,3-rhamnosyl/mannosyltransferase